MTEWQGKEKPGQADEPTPEEWTVQRMLAVVNAIYFLQEVERFPPS